MKYLKIVLLLLGTGCFSFAKAQTHSPDFFGVSWEIAFPANSGYLTKTSLAGGRLEYRRKLNPQFSVGIAASWNSFDQYFGSQTYQSKDGGRAVTTDMVRQIYTVPITLIGHYYPKMANKAIQPYIGIGLGTQYAEQNAYFNIYELSNYNWGFVARPEIGTFFNFQSNFKIMLTASYNFATNKNSEFNISHINQFGINVGVGWGF